MCAEFVYLGEVSVSQPMLQSFLKTAGLLRIRGLAEQPEDEAAPADHYHAKRKRKPSKPEAAAKLEEIHVRKRKSATTCGGQDHGSGGGVLDPPAAKMHCTGGGGGGAYSGGVKNGGADLLGGGSSISGSDDLMLKQEPVDPGTFCCLYCYTCQ